MKLRRTTEKKTGESGPAPKPEAAPVVAARGFLARLTSIMASPAFGGASAENAKTAAGRALDELAQAEADAICGDEAAQGRLEGLRQKFRELALDREVAAAVAPAIRQKVAAFKDDGNAALNALTSYLRTEWKSAIQTLVSDGTSAMMGSMDGRKGGDAPSVILCAVRAHAITSSLPGPHAADAHMALPAWWRSAVPGSTDLAELVERDDRASELRAHFAELTKLHSELEKLVNGKLRLLWNAEIAGPRRLALARARVARDQGIGSLVPEPPKAA